MSLITLIMFIIAIALFVGAAALIMQAMSKYGKGFTLGKTVAAALMIIFAILTLFVSMGLKEVGPGQEGVKTRFGAVEEGTMVAGLRWIMPMVEGLVIYETRVQPLDFTDVKAATKDLQPVGLTGQIRYHLNTGEADDMLKNVGGPGDYAEKILIRPAETILKDVTPRYNAENIIGKRVEIGNITASELQEAVAPYGITIDGVSVTNAALAEAFLTSVEAKQIAAQDADRALNRAEEQRRLAEGEKDAAITRAEGEKESRILVADGEAQANDLINASLTDDLLTWRAIDKINPNVDVMLIPQDQGFIIDLGQVKQQTEEAQQ